LPLDAQRLGDFLVDLTDLWLERGYGRGIKVGPSSEILDYYLHGDTVIPCFWHDNCANNFVCIDPAGNVSQCDCWVASYPEMRFGNLLEDGPLWTLLEKSSARQRFLERPATLLQERDCIECEHLAICHGGCPVRAYSTFGTLLEKDPYCETYKILFARMQEISARIASLGITG
jgi:radical SAM protein with 4Fe4S-binding SPASM domain